MEAMEGVEEGAPSDRVVRELDIYVCNGGLGDSKVTAPLTSPWWLFCYVYINMWMHFLRKLESKVSLQPQEISFISISCI